LARALEVAALCAGDGTPVNIKKTAINRGVEH
jgi:hypothetical protein